MFRYLVFLTISFCFASGPACTAASAQSLPAATITPDSLIALQQGVIAADSTGDAHAAVAARLAVVPFLPGNKALRLLQEARLLADSNVVDATLALRVHKGMVDAFTSMGEMTKANREWAEVLRLNGIVMREEAAVTLERERAASIAKLASVKDSLAGLLSAERAGSTDRENAMKAQQDQWMYVATGAGMLALLALIGLGVLFFGSLRRMRGELKELKQEVTWLRLVNRKKLEEERASSANNAVPPAPSPETRVVPPNVVSDPVTMPHAEDAALLELLKRRSVERLRTLREARMRGDRDKVVRVVHSLKPQLVALDAAHYADLCARLVATNVDASAWSADLDRFERDMQSLIEGRR